MLFWSQKIGVDIAEEEPQEEAERWTIYEGSPQSYFRSVTAALPFDDTRIFG